MGPALETVTAFTEDDLRVLVVSADSVSETQTNLTGFKVKQ